MISNVDRHPRNIMALKILDRRLCTDRVTISPMKTKPKNNNIPSKYKNDFSIQWENTYKKPNANPLINENNNERNMRFLGIFKE